MFSFNLFFGTIFMSGRLLCVVQVFNKAVLADEISEHLGLKKKISKVSNKISMFSEMQATRKYYNLNVI